MKVGKQRRLTQSAPQIERLTHDFHV